MDLIAHVNELLARVADLIGLKAGDVLRLDENNECLLSIEKTFILMLYLEEESKCLIINLPVAPLPDGSGRLDTLMELMAANYSWNRTDGATIGLDASTGLICLSYLVPLPLEPVGEIRFIVEKLINVTRHWRREIPALGEAWEQSDHREHAGMHMLRV